MRARLQGFVIFDYEDRYEEARINLSKWLKEEKLKMPTHLVEGDIDKFPEIFEDLYKGKNYGKFVLKLND
jgi:NADPH-dependent curcumin reductase CurA